jgi:uncharacterized protein
MRIKFMIHRKYTLLFIVLGALITAFQVESPFVLATKKFRKIQVEATTKGTRPLFSKEESEKINFFAPDPTYAVKAKYTILENEQPFDMPTTSGKTKQYMKRGFLTFELKKKTFKLICYENLQLTNMKQYKNRMFVPFKDSTNTVTTYGAGRYLEVFIDPLITKEVILDFNRCYNPFCAYKSGFNCPVVPRDNYLETSIEAGEKKYHSE